MDSFDIIVILCLTAIPLSAVALFLHLRTSSFKRHMRDLDEALRDPQHVIARAKREGEAQRIADEIKAHKEKSDG